jgi:acyl carrier protein phosphodiesterase
MNYLAHLFLAEEKGRIGGLLGDFEKGNIKGKYRKEIEIEIEIHRKIDYYTDTHEVIKEAKKLFPEERRKYAGILLDVFYDHVLAKNWDKYSNTELASFTKQVYSLLLRDIAILPDKLQQTVPVMVQEDWLISYTDFNGFESAINRISQRLKRSNSLLDCISDIYSNYQAFSSGFEVFFPQLISYVSEQRFLLYSS